MAKQKVVHLVCDQCGRKGAHQWVIRNPDGEQARVDLCSKCDDPVRRAHHAGRHNAPGPVGSETIQLTEDYSPVLNWVKAQEKAAEKRG